MMGALLRDPYVVLLLFSVLVLVPPTQAALRDWRPSDFRFVTKTTSLGGECGGRPFATQAPWSRRISPWMVNQVPYLVPLEQ